MDSTKLELFLLFIGNSHVSGNVRVSLVIEKKPVLEFSSVINGMLCYLLTFFVYGLEYPKPPLDTLGIM